MAAATEGDHTVSPHLFALVRSCILRSKARVIEMMNYLETLITDGWIHVGIFSYT